jgi:HEAT repeat protein
MNRSKPPLVASILILLVACGVACFELKESNWPDLSSEAQIRKLSSHWASRRRAAAAELAQFPGEAQTVVPALTKALGDSDTQVRLVALESLRNYRERAKLATEALRKLLKEDSDAKVRLQAIALLGVLQDRESVAVMIDAMDNPDPAVRLEAIRALGRFGRSIASDPLVDKLMAVLTGDYPVELRDASLEALDSIAADQERVARAKAEVLAKDPSPELRLKAVGVMKKPTFAFVIPALIAALDDPSPQVRLSAGANLAWIGLNDDRTVPALCRAAIKANDATREGIAMIVDGLILDYSRTHSPDDQVTRRFLTAVKELRSVLETRNAAAREQVVNVLGRLIAYYQKTGKQALLEPARAAALAVLARMEDETEEIPLRLLAMNQWSIVLPAQQPASSSSGARSAAPVPRDELHPRALWVAPLARALKSPGEAIRSRAVEILMGSLSDPGFDPSFREAWLKAVPTLAEATKSDGGEVRDGVLAILGRLGPEAGEALPILRLLAHDSKDPNVRSTAEAAIKSISSLDHLKAKDPAERIAAAATLGRLGWRAAPGVPALIVAIKDPDVNVRLASANALRSLRQDSQTAVTPLSQALLSESSASVRVAILETLEAIAPGTRPVLDAHKTALRDPEAQVRKAAATFEIVPADESLISALETALGDSSDQVQLAAAGSLSQAMFENALAIPTLVKALGNDTQRKAVLRALDEHLELASDRAVSALRREDISGLRSTLALAIPALRDGLNVKNDEVRIEIYRILGRILGFSRLSRDADFHKAIEPALQPFLDGLDDANPDVRQEVLDRLNSIAIRRSDIVSALLKDLQRSDQSEEDHQRALAALAAQEAFADLDVGLRDTLKPAVSVLAKALDSPTTELRGAAVRALGHIGGEAKQAMETLRKLASQDPQESVRKDAGNAIKAINGTA